MPTKRGANNGRPKHARTQLDDVRDNVAVNDNVAKGQCGAIDFAVVGHRDVQATTVAFRCSLGQGEAHLLHDLHRPKSFQQ